MPKEETDIQKLAEYAGKFFELHKRGDEGDEETFWVAKERHPVWIYEMNYKVHDNGKMLRDDYKYQYIVEALNYVSEGNDPEEPQFEADPYTSNLLAWLGSNSERLWFVDEAVRDFGWDKERGIEGAIATGQVMEKEKVFRSVVNALEERLKAIEAGEMEIFKTRSGGVEGPFDWWPS
jgi:hypothetical protein